MNKVKHEQENSEPGEKNRELNFVNKQSLNRVTNAMIKTLLKNKSAEDKVVNATGRSFPRVDKQIKKKEKKNLKKEIWTKSSINSLHLTFSLQCFILVTVSIRLCLFIYLFIFVILRDWFD